MEKYGYGSRFGPWNIHEGPIHLARQCARRASPKNWPSYRTLGFDAVQLHDDDAVPNLDGLAPADPRSGARAAADDRRSRPGRRVCRAAAVGTPPDHRRGVHGE